MIFNHHSTINRYFKFASLLTLAILTACSASSPLPKTLDNFCREELDGKTVELQAYLSYKNFMVCGEDSWGKARCPLTLESEAGGPSFGHAHYLWIYLGNAANRMLMPTKTNFELADIEVFGSDGKRLDLELPVKVLAEVDYPDDIKYGSECSLDALELSQVQR